jgi:hypothetical protein
MSEHETTNTTPDKGALIIERSLRFSVVASAVIVLASTLLFDLMFTVSVLFGSAIAIGNLRLLRWMAQRWMAGQRDGLLPLLFGKLWGAAILIFAALWYLPIQPEGVILGMMASLLALLWSATIDGRALMREATESSNDA